MIEPRLSAEMIVQSLIRKVNQEGGFGAVIRKGDRISGAILIICIEKGKDPRLLEKMPSLDGPAIWQVIWPQDIEKEQVLDDYLERRTGFDPDLWLIELDIPDAERLIAQMT
ncbi:DUF1491 family protein [Parasphingorhabdus cellanae]|uniref:DUF1491 family protein n=1 Tax=Parasphingorhabdus cellanae TaxID=2806553 RepID=A0ABX7T2J0_9SPHN|nr:DUF1491 family protein [Parasphingorhabdus cellanae]QTD54749.1 DUF1491 family protein [Parasphingorhabdus cellanae]